MGLKVTGVNETLLNMERTERRTNKALLRHLRRSAERIRDLASARAPIDEGDLESALIVFEEDRGSTSGHYRKTEYVGVDPDRLGEGYQRYGYRYDVRMHEGEYELGPLSKAKAAANGEPVGPKYLESAFEDLEDDIMDEYRAILRRNLGD